MSRFNEGMYPQVPGYREAVTSKAAVADAEPSAENLRSIVLCALKMSPGTVHEIAAFAHLSVPTIQPRFSELRKMGKIEPTGERRKNASDSKAHVWRAV